mmetsp:Transcript_22438/g.52204  ORF Transcript_22438/g.52204 Transcript_22438/m.52204 type:complete len:209 (-) Transcript_22438:947-1573(-)
MGWAAPMHPMAMQSATAALQAALSNAAFPQQPLSTAALQAALGNAALLPQTPGTAAFQTPLGAAALPPQTPGTTALQQTAPGNTGLPPQPALQQTAQAPLPTATPAVLQQPAVAAPAATAAAAAAQPAAPAGQLNATQKAWLEAELQHKVAVNEAAKDRVAAALVAGMQDRQVAKLVSDFVRRHGQGVGVPRALLARAEAAFDIAVGR